MNFEGMVYSFKAKDGLLIGVRPLRRDDAVYLVDIYEHMSSNSRYQRFHQTTDHFQARHIWQEAETIAQMDYQKQYGFMAFADLPEQPNAPIGAARYVCLGDGRAETAVSVRDDMQSKGIGTKLLALLAEEARQRGIVTLTADVLNENKAIMRVLKKLPYAITRKPEGAYATLEVHLNQPKKTNDNPSKTAAGASSRL